MVDTLIEEPLGQGAQGQVFKYRNKENGTSVAVKRIPFQNGSLSNAIYSEIQKSPQFQSNYLVHISGHFFQQLNDKEYAINVIMEYCDGGNLKQFYYECARKRSLVPEKVLVFFSSPHCSLS